MLAELPRTKDLVLSKQSTLLHQLGAAAQSLGG